MSKKMLCWTILFHFNAYKLPITQPIFCCFNYFPFWRHNKFWLPWMYFLLVYFVVCMYIHKGPRHRKNDRLGLEGERRSGEEKEREGNHNIYFDGKGKSLFMCVCNGFAFHTQINVHTHTQTRTQTWNTLTKKPI